MVGAAFMPPVSRSGINAAPTISRGKRPLPTVQKSHTHLTYIALATLATRLRIPYAILLVLGGLLLGFVPGLPRIVLNPELVLVLFLPPLIYSSAWLTSWREFHANLRSILQLALGLVLGTTIVL